LNGSEQPTAVAIDQFVKRFSVIELKTALDQLSVRFAIRWASHVMLPPTQQRLQGSQQK
jgi:hypothetical protein